jgi:hypothetical protein
VALGAGAAAALVVAGVEIAVALLHGRATPVDRYLEEWPGVPVLDHRRVVNPWR